MSAPSGTAQDRSEERDGSGHSHVIEERSLLINLAYRLLGSLAEAEDAVQEAYLRWYALSPRQRLAIVSATRSPTSPMSSGARRLPVANSPPPPAGGFAPPADRGRLRRGRTASSRLSSTPWRPVRSTFSSVCWTPTPR